jgi:hypothetical protein
MYNLLTTEMLSCRNCMKSQEPTFSFNWWLTYANQTDVATRSKIYTCSSTSKTGNWMGERKYSDGHPDGVGELLDDLFGVEIEISAPTFQKLYVMNSSVDPFPVQWLPPRRAAPHHSHPPVGCRSCDQSSCQCP